MSLLNKLFSARGGSALGGKKSKPATKRKEEKKVSGKIVEAPKKTEPTQKVAEFKSGGILVAPHTAEKAIAGQKLNQYVFKIARKANKISVAKEIKRVYNVKAVKVNVINIPKKARQVGKTRGFKAGYKKAIVTLAPGQSIELK